MTYTIEQLQTLIDNSVAGEWRLNRAEVRGYADNVNDGYGQAVCLVANMETSDGDLLAASKAMAQQLIQAMAHIRTLEAERDVLRARVTERETALDTLRSRIARIGDEHLDLFQMTMTTEWTLDVLEERLKLTGESEG